MRRSSSDHSTDAARSLLRSACRRRPRCGNAATRRCCYRSTGQTDIVPLQRRSQLEAGSVNKNRTFNTVVDVALWEYVYAYSDGMCQRAAAGRRVPQTCRRSQCSGRLLRDAPDVATALSWQPLDWHGRRMRLTSSAPSRRRRIPRQCAVFICVLF